MKKSLLLLVLNSAVIIYLQGQTVSDYTYTLDNGINVKTERCWNQVWVQQSFSPFTSTDKTSLAVNIRTLGDLMSGSSFKLISGGKEVRLQNATPGTYKLQLSFRLSGKPGTLSFVVDNVIIKSNSKTTLSVTLYEYQILIEEKPGTKKGLSTYETRVNRCKGNTIQDLYSAIPVFYEKGNNDKIIKPDEVLSNTKGNIKPGTYDLLISIGISGQTHKIWLQNFAFKPDVSYKISTNLNAGEISYTGGNKDVKAMNLYPAGTAGKQTGNPAPVKNLELISYDNLSVQNCCAPGAYDVLLNFGNGSKYEWRKSIIIQTGQKTEVK